MAHPYAATVLCLVLVLRMCDAEPSSLPLPFKRTLRVQTPNLAGSDVVIMQHFLNRSVRDVNISGIYDIQTAKAIVEFQKSHHLSASNPGVFGPEEARALLSCCSADGYVDDGRPANEKGYMYKVHVRVNANRSIEHNATLFDGQGKTMFSFRVRAHGHSNLHPDAPWPVYSTDDGINQFTSSGNTPTGLMSFDLNSPEDVPKLYGPYPVNRAVAGLEGNARFLLPHIRNGILMHTGEWPGWSPPEDMPDSAGCIHSWPENIERVYKALVSIGVKIRPNTNGKIPYPYRPQGLLSVELIE